MHCESISLPWLKRQADKDGVARFIGSGTDVWSNVHIDDLIELYRPAFDKAPAGSRYLVENGERNFADIAQTIADRLGLGQAQPWSVDEATAQVDKTCSFIFGSNGRQRTTRAFRTALATAGRLDARLDSAGGLNG